MNERIVPRSTYVTECLERYAPDGCHEIVDVRRDRDDAMRIGAEMAEFDSSTYRTSEMTLQ